MSKWRVKVGHNRTQIKDGWIVRLYKDGRIKSKIAEWKPKPPKPQA